MKRIFFGPNGKINWHNFFWEPWGVVKYLLRLFLFAILLVLLVWLISMFRDCSGWHDPILTPRHRGRIIMPDTTTVIDRNIPNPGPHLPAPPENVLPPVSDDDIIRDDIGRPIVNNRLGIILDSTPGEETFRQWADAFKSIYPSDDYVVEYYNAYTKLLRIRVPADKREQVMNELPRKIRNVSFMVFPDAILEDNAIPSDPAFGIEDNYDWYFDPIQAYEAWDITMGSEDVVVAIVDSSFDLIHEELNSDRIHLPYNVTRDNGNVAPGNSQDLHGTMVASMAIGNVNNRRGLSGIAPKCKFMPVSLGDQPYTTFQLLSGVLYSIYQGADVVNVSIGGDWGALAGLPIEGQVRLGLYEGLEEEAVWRYVYQLANDRNVMVVWAAGNSNVFVGLDPYKRDKTTLRVSAVDQNLQKANFSNFGNIPEYNLNEISVSAPGVSIFGAVQNNSFTTADGTSFSAPLVTGAVALMKSLEPELTNAEIVKIIKETSKPIDGGDHIGGLLQIHSALKKVQENAN